MSFNLQGQLVFVDGHLVKNSQRSNDAIWLLKNVVVTVESMMHALPCC